MREAAAVAASRSEPGRAARLLEATGTHLYAQMDDELRQRVADAAREQLGERAWTSARGEGRAMSFEEAVAYARWGRSSAYTEIRDACVRVSTTTRSSS